MFKNQLIELGEMVNNLNSHIANLEDSLKLKKEELRDVKQAYASIERIQSKYDKCEDDEVIECEE